MSPLAPALLLVLAATLATTSAANAPVVIVPGLAGSQLRAKLTDADPPHWWCHKNHDWFTTWLVVDQLIPEQKDCLLSRLVTTFDPSDRSYHNAKGVEIDVVDFGGVDGISFLDPSVHESASKYFVTMIEFLEKELGYKRGVDLHGAPYDWRMAPDHHTAPGQFYDRLQALVERTSKSNGGAKVHLIAHSLGGPTTLMFLNTRSPGWVEQHIASFVPINAPWGGGTAMALSDVSGYEFGLSVVPTGYLKPVQDSSASGVFILPTAEVFGDATVVTSSTRSYTSSELSDMLEDLGLDQAHAIMKNLDAKKLNSADLRAPGCPSLVFSSRGLETGSQYVYDVPFTRGMKATAPVRVVNEDGDGLVNLPSLRHAAVEPEVGGQLHELAHVLVRDVDLVT